MSSKLYRDMEESVALVRERNELRDMLTHLQAHHKTCIDASVARENALRAKLDDLAKELRETRDARDAALKL